MVISPCGRRRTAPDLHVHQRLGDKEADRQRADDGEDVDEGGDDENGHREPGVFELVQGNGLLHVLRDVAVRLVARPAQACGGRTRCRYHSACDERRFDTARNY